MPAVVAGGSGGAGAALAVVVAAARGSGPASTTGRGPAARPAGTGARGAFTMRSQLPAAIDVNDTNQTRNGTDAAPARVRRRSNAMQPNTQPMQT